MVILVQFLFRLSFGLSLAMALVPARKVTSGYFKNHLWVVMGMSVLAAAVLFGLAREGLVADAASVGADAGSIRHVETLLDASVLSPWLAVAAAGLSYLGSVLWLYEKPRAGRTALCLVAAVTLIGALLTMIPRSPGALDHLSWLANLVIWSDPVLGGLLLGTTIAAMFLGHWYLNTPTMALAPLKRLVLLMGGAIALRSAGCGLGLALFLIGEGTPSTTLLCFLALRWLAGLFAAAVVVVMTWETLKIPNTQSATGILYVGVIVTFLGELAAQLLSAQSPLLL